MISPLRLWLLPVVLVAGAAGCLGLPPKGPLDVRLVDANVEGLRHVNVTLAFQNTGEKPLTRMEVLVHPRIAQEGRPDRLAGRLMDYPAKYKYFPAVFNETDVLQPGAEHVVTLHAYFEPDPSFEVRPDDIYMVDIGAAFQDDTTRWRWRHTPPCFDANGELRPRAHGVCDGWFTFSPTALEP